MKRFLPIMVLLFLFSLVAAKSYDLPNAQVDYYLNPDGTVHVTERITYDLHGSFTELFRQLPKDMKISDSSGHCEGKPCTFYTQFNQGYFELVLKSKYSDEKVTAVFDYVVDGQVLAQKDASQFFYKLWGDTSSEGVDKLVATVHLPGSASETIYFIHPASDSITSTKSGNTITLTSTNHPAKTYLEINLLMPQGWFSGLLQAKNYMTKQEIVAGENRSAEDQKNMVMFFLLFSVFMALVIPVLFLICYLVYGREKPIENLGFFGPYEHEPPSDLSPSEAQYLLDQFASPNALSGELLYLVQKGYLKMETVEIELAELLGTAKKKVLAFSIIEGKSEEGLKPCQQSILYFIRSSFNGRFIIEQVKTQNKILQYSYFYQEFSGSVKSEFDKRKYINSTGNTIMAVASFLFATAAIFTFQVIPFIEAFIVVFIVARYPQILGKWTDEGRVQEYRWKNFKRYLSDMTLMREKPPASIVLWELYLVYAAAFGVSETTLKAMKLYAPADQQKTSAFVVNSVCLASFSHSMSSMTAASTPRGSGRGGFGGGGGGGGGGCGAR